MLLQARLYKIDYSVYHQLLTAQFVKEKHFEELIMEYFVA